jgi:hypothetical protein
MEYKHDKKIADKIRAGIRQGISPLRIFEANKHLQAMPQAHSTYYKVYERDIAEAKLEVDERLTDAFWHKISEGDSKLIEFGLKTKAGWNAPVKTVDATDEPDENSDSLEVLKDKLAKIAGNNKKEE